ncbi:unnamed protein product [Diabrotica balteata]|uniref:Vacuolar-sorting protein SNF8 n=1 Tax=Diabrotica balteata TaxID=107213 RepID=A0A9N9T8E3_DIABA|nr:unnamed protein product [Diabrotica balteata]
MLTNPILILVLEENINVENAVYQTFNPVIYSNEDIITSARLELSSDENSNIGEVVHENFNPELSNNTVAPDENCGSVLTTDSNNDAIPSSSFTDLQHSPTKEINPGLTIKRKGIADPSTWTRNVRKEKRVSGKTYEMCASIGVDPLSSGKGFWSVLGIGDFYYELAVQIVEVCLSTTAKNGGLISLDELRTRLIKARGQSKTHQEITKDDLIRAARKLKIFGNGFNVIPMGKDRYMVQSVPGELNMDHSVLLQQAEKNKACVSASHLISELNWERQRAEKALEHMINQGLAWIDSQHPEEPQYYFPSLYTACINSNA